MTTKVNRPPQTPAWLAFKAACNRKGMLIYRVASLAGMSYVNAFQMLNEVPGAANTPEKLAALAGALGMQPEEIWPVADAAPAPADAGASGAGDAA